MESERWREVRAVFDEVVDLTPAARGERLAEVGTADPELRRAVEALLAADAESEESLAGMMNRTGTILQSSVSAGSTCCSSRMSD